MLPIKLEIEGLYSYKEKQIIDFETLTSSWLFGIFGKVGSGKSSIIDAITLAIYGEVERLGGRDDKNYNLMNLDSNILLIDFECKIKDKHYKFRYSSKRNGRNHDRVNSPKKIISVLENNEWIPIDKKGEEILNISYRNFKQAVVIPQGRFQEFISQGPSDRTKMLSEIFKLNRYDLSGNIKKLKEEAKDKKIAIETLLSDIPQINKDELNENKELLVKYKESIKNLKKEFEVLDKKRMKISKAKDIFDDYVKTLDFYNKYKIINDNLSSIKEKIVIFERIKPLIVKNSRISNKLSEKNDYLNELKEKKILKEQELVEINENFDNLKLKEEEITKKNIFIEDFKNILKINKLVKKIEEISLTKGKLENEIKNLTTEKYEIDKTLKVLEIDKDNLKNKIKDFDFIDELKEWYLKNNYLVNELKKLNDEFIKFTNKVNELKDDKIKILEQIKDENLLLIKKEELIGKIAKLNLNHKLSSFTKEIKDGEPCPLCGSFQHPNILEIDDVNDELKVTENELNTLEKDIKNNQKFKNDIELINLKIDDNSAKIVDNEKDINMLNLEISDLESKFKWSEKYKKLENIEDLKKEKLIIENKIVEIELKIKKNNKIKEKINSRIQKNEIDLSRVLTEFTLKTEDKNELINKLKKLNNKDYLSSKNEEIDEYISKYTNEINSYNNELSKLIKQLDSLKSEVNTISSRIPELASDVYDLKIELAENDDKLKNVYQETNLDEALVAPILKEKFNLKQKKLEVSEAEKKYSIFKFKLYELLEKKSQNPYSEDEFLENNIIIAKNREKLEKLINDAANLDTEIKNNINNLAKFENNIKSRNKIVKRFDNLVVLEKLFKGQKFVEFVANFYLRALIANANKRFSKLTKHQLSLGINKDGNFIVKDFLNAGRVRLLKTLSGGQTFQASFCIALALAESINTLNNQSENFFFIDEGFGSLDKDSLRLVFDTLNSLRYEKRIVGVISHVEDFKREVDVSITIRRDKKIGTVVKTSW